MAEEKHEPDKDPELPDNITDDRLDQGDDQLAENISRVLADAQMPKLDDQTAGRILAELKSKQQELFQNGHTDMATTATHYAQAWQEKNESKWSSGWVLILPALLLITLLIGGLMYLEITQQSPDEINGNVVQGDGDDTNNTKQLQVAQDLGKFSEGKLTRREMADGTILIANAFANYSIDGPRSITLNAGELFLIVVKSRMPFVVSTDEGEVRATGTRFSVSANKSEKMTSAAVAQGTVELDGAAGGIQLTAGQRGSLQRDKKPTREPAPRLSHLVSWAKEALAQEELLVEPAKKENGLVAVDPNGQESKLSLRKYHVNIYIEDGIARTTIDQTFFNHNPWNTEGTFYFPLPPDASVSRLAMYVAGNLNEGGMVSRERGQQIYTDILHTQRDPALLEMMEGNMFKMRIFPLEGRQEKRIFLSYTQKLSELYGTMRYWFPMDHTNSVAGEVSISVRVKDGAKTFAPQSSTHDVKVKTDGDDLLLEYSQEKIKPDQDFLLHLVPEKKLDPARVSVCEKDGKKFLFARIHPEIEGAFSSEPRQWIVLNDVSASRSKIESQAQRYVLSRLIEEADDNDSIHLIDLNTRAIPVTVKPLNVRSDAARKLGDHRMEFKIGACNVEAGIAAVKKAIADYDLKNPHLVYLGDGVATDGQRDLSQLAGLLPRDVPFIGVGVGKSVDALFMQTAADMTGGMFSTINPDEDIDWRVFDLVAALNTPRMNKVEVLLFDENDKPVDAIAYPSSRGLADGETLTVVARCDGELPSELVFRGKVNGKTVAMSTELTGAKENAEFIPRLWAKRHIDELLKSDMPREEEITELSKEYYVVTPYTSLIVLESDAMYEEYKVERGRKDHWALYDAPKTIEIVREEIDWNRWGWYGNWQGEDSKVGTKTEPKTVQEIVDNMQLRINAPFYFYPPTAPNSSRTGLYLLAESLLDDAEDSNSDELADDEKKYLAAIRSQSNRLLAFWYLATAGRQDVLRRTATQTDENSDGDSDESKLGQERQLGGKRAKRMLAKLPMLGRMGAAYGRPPLTLRMGQDAFGLMGEDEYLPELYGTRIDDGVELFGPSLALGNDAQPIQSQLMLPLQFAGTATGGIQRDLRFSFQQAMQTRWGRINRDVENHNRQYGHWGWRSNWNTWDVSGGIDLRNVTRNYWNDGLEELLEREEELMQLNAASSMNESIMDARLFARNGEFDGTEFENARFSIIPNVDFDIEIDGLYDMKWMDTERMSFGLPSAFEGVDVSKDLSSGFLRTPAALGNVRGGGVGGGGRAFGRGWYYSPVTPMYKGVAQQLPQQTRFRGTEINGRFLRARGMYMAPGMQMNSKSEVFYEHEFRGRLVRPLLTYTSLARRQTNQPAMVSAIAADFLKERRDELVREKLDEKNQSELELLNAALDNVEASAARVENSGPFWNGGWSYQPRVGTFQPPQIQAWNGYSWAFDLTRYAGGLYTNNSDILGEVAAEYGTAKPLGKFSDDARNQIELARAAIAPVRISAAVPSDDQKAGNGDVTDEVARVELLVASGDRFALTTKSDMYLTERMICDGKNIWQLYDELGIAARREATELRLSALRNMVPHLLPPADVLSMFHNIELIAQDDESFTLKLTIAEQPEPVSEPNAESKDDAAVDSLDSEEASEVAQIVLIIRIDRTGRILEKTLQINAENLLKVVFDYKSTEDHVSIKWLAMMPVQSDEEKETAADAKEELKKEWTTVASSQYAARSGMLLESVFEAQKETDEMVVIDMPLKRPAYYSDKIAEINGKSTDTGASSDKTTKEQPEDQPEKQLTDKDRFELIRLYRLHALSSIQELTWRRWNQECAPAKSSMLKVLELQKETGSQTRLGDVTLLGSSGAYGMQDLLKDYLARDRVNNSTKNLTRLNRENVLVRFFQNSRNHGWQLDDKTFADESGLVGHVAAFAKSNNWSDREHLFADFEKRFSHSPLMLALVSRHAQQTSKIEPWLKLNLIPRWRGLALLMAAPHTQEGQQPQFAKAYWDWREKIKETQWFKAGGDLPLNAQISTILQTATPNKFTEMIDQRLERVKKADSMTALILFAEQAASWGIPDTASSVMKLAQAKAESKIKDGRMPLSIRQALAEGYWTCNLYKPSLEHFDTMLRQLEAEKVSPSPALLASAARVASQAGNSDRAIELEERALALEHKYLPEMINLTAFNQRYTWLWQQYQQAIANAKNDPEEVKRISTRAKDAWLRWQEVDKDNLAQASNVATLLKTAGADDEEIWLHLSTAIDRKPRDSASYATVANWYQSQSELDKTERFLEEAYRWDTANPQLLYQRAEVLESLKRSDEAVALYKQLAEGKWASGLQGWAEKAKEKLKGIEDL